MRREILLLEEIVTAASRATDIASRHSVASLTVTLDARDALLWNLTIVGEAVGQLPDELLDEHPEVPWHQPVRLRNRIVHGYWSVDLDIIYSVAIDDLPTFTNAVRAILEAS